MAERGSIYPSWRYHATEPPTLCLDAAHDARLGDDWSDKDIRVLNVPAELNHTPIDFDEAAPAPMTDAPKKKPGRKPKA